MKITFLFGVIAALLVQVIARNVPINTRTHGNFGPNIKHSFKMYGTRTKGIFLNKTVDLVADTIEFLMTETRSTEQPQVSSSHTSAHNGVTHLYFQQIVNGLQVVNGVANINLGRNGEILSFGHSFYSGSIPKHLNHFTPKYTTEDAVNALANLVKMNLNKFRESKENPPKLKYIQVNNGQDLALVWDIVQGTKANMYNAIVSVESNEVLQLDDWVSDASHYNVYPVGVNDPSKGDRDIVKDPAHKLASPLGWHMTNISEGNHTTTRGNNVFAQENLDGDYDYLNNYRPNGTSELSFDFPIDFNKQPIEYLDASITNLFYWNNIIHDLFYVYGFNEESGNFQQNNFGYGGTGNDEVIANAQHGEGTNNAFFMTPPDGQNGRMFMLIFTITHPARDSALENGVIMHEYLHGISNRLTGGRNNVECLGWGESGGMGEGWGDLFATIIRCTINSTRNDAYELGDYLSGGRGIRNFPYTTNMEVNPLTYSDTLLPEYYEHDIGEVWAVTLYEVFWNLVEKHGFDPDWFNNDQKEVKAEGSYKSIIDGREIKRSQWNGHLGGNVIFFQLVVDGMKLQPCYPTFIDGRDAIIHADLINNFGENECELWKGFAKRGLGVDARSPGHESFSFPSYC